MAAVAKMRRMELTELWLAHWTEPKLMAGAPRLRQHDNFHKQLSAFVKLTEHAANKFSKDQLYQMLRILARGIPKLKGTNRSHSDESFANEISSMKRLREILESFEKRKRRGIQKEEEAHVVKYFSVFFNDVKKLKDYKKYFDERIYQCLYEYFYDPSEDFVASASPTPRPNHRLRDVRARELTHSDDADSGNFSDEVSPRPGRYATPRGRLKRTKSLNKLSIGKPVLQTVDETATKEKLSWAVNELNSTNQKWDNLLTESRLDEDDFEPDSENEVAHYPNHEQFTAILRLQPDIFMKSYKSVELAKIWWTQANKLRKVLPVRQKTEEDIELKSKSIKYKIKELEYFIAKGQKNLEEFKVILENVTSREKRADDLAADCEQLEEMKINAESKYKQVLQDRRVTIRKFEYAIKGTSKYFELQRLLKEHDHRVSEAYNSLRVLRYQFEVMHEDFLVEIEVRPNFIRFTDHVKEMIGGMKDTLTKMKLERRQHEKELALMKTNTETMRSVMRKQVGSAESVVRGPKQVPKVQHVQNERDNTYDVIRTASKARPSAIPKPMRPIKDDLSSPVWSESERSEGLPDGHEADSELSAANRNLFAKYTRLLKAERKGRTAATVQAKQKTRWRPEKRASKLPRPV